MWIPASAGMTLRSRGDLHGRPIIINNGYQLAVDVIIHRNNNSIEGIYLNKSGYAWMITSKRSEVKRKTGIPNGIPVLL